MPDFELILDTPKTPPPIDRKVFKETFYMMARLSDGKILQVDLAPVDGDTVRLEGEDISGLYVSDNDLNSILNFIKANLNDNAQFTGEEPPRKLNVLSDETP